MATQTITGSAPNSRSRLVKATVAHHVRGRLRVRIAGKHHGEMLKQIAESLCGVEGVKRVAVHPSTGSLIIQYSDRHSPKQFESALAEHGEDTRTFALSLPEMSEVDQLASLIEREATALAAHSEIARVIVGAVKQADDTLRRLTGNNLDLKVLLPLGLAAWAIIENDPEISTPLWLTLSIFSFNSFLSLHDPQSMTVETQQVISQPGGKVTATKTTTTQRKIGS